MRDISKPEKPALTDADHRDGKPRWEIANLTEGEWRRALGHNDREISEVTPGSPEFARLMEVRHRMAFPPPKGVKYDDISRYHAEQIRKELEATMPARPRIERRWVLLAAGFIALAVAGGALLASELGRDRAVTPSAAPPLDPAPTAKSATATAAAPEPAATTTAPDTTTPEPTGSASSTAPDGAGARPPTSAKKAGDPAPAASPAQPPAPAATSSNPYTPYFMPQSK
jgi:hypothetical protein